MSIQAITVDPNVLGKLAVNSVEDPRQSGDRALVRVSAISLNRGEVNRAQSSPAGTRLGWDIAGVVEAAAGDGSGPKAGNRVVGVMRTGAWAELVAIPSADLAVLPDNVSFAAAATLPVAGLTALYALDRGDGLVERNVLVTGASGGVGHFAVQIAKRAGAHVVGLVRQPGHAGIVEEAGADAVVADETGEASRAHGPYDLILESVGGQVMGNNLTMLAPGGQLVLYGTSGGGPATFDTRQASANGLTVSTLRVFTLITRDTGAVGLGRLARMVGDGSVKPLISVEASWREAGAIARQLIDRGFPGKAVLTVD
jgi:NADPH:quinone reductase-like Zn-dependent oxidoreductase